MTALIVDAEADGGGEKAPVTELVMELVVNVAVLETASARGRKGHQVSERGCTG